MTKTVIIPDDIHMRIVERQMYIRKNFGVSVRITDMLVAYVKAGMDRTEELLNIKTDSIKIQYNEEKKVEKITG